MAQRILSLLVVCLTVAIGKISGQSGRAPHFFEISSESKTWNSFAPARFSENGLPEFLHKKMVKKIFGASTLTLGVQSERTKYLPMQYSFYRVGLKAPHATSNMPSIHLGFSPDFVVRNFSFFCRNEYRFEQATGIPLRFRLGSLDYVNRLEYPGEK